MSARQSAIVDEALRLVAQGMTPYAAAKKTGIAMSTVYKAVKRHRSQAPDPALPASPGASLPGSVPPAS